MCRFQGKPVGEYCSCCQECPLYLNTCVPIVIGGFVSAECDFNFCDYCPCYGECEVIWGKEVFNYEVVEL